MSQPTYDDLGKSCKEFFNKGYYLNIFKLSAKKAKAFWDVDTIMTCTHHFEDETVECDFENKYCYPCWGLSTSTKIDTANLLSWKLDICNKIANGLKLSLDGQFNLDTAVKTAKINTTYKIPQATFDLGLSGGDEANLLVGGSAVGGYETGCHKFLGGYQLAYDTNEGTLQKNNLALGYIGNGFTVHSNVDNAETIAAIVHYKMKNNMEIALNGTYTSGDETGEKTRYGIGLKYIANPCTSFKAKIDNTKTITMACEMRVTDAATLTMCADFDGATSGKVGAACEFCN